MPACKADNRTWYVSSIASRTTSVSDCMIMKFSDFVKHYEEDVKPRVEYNTCRTKQHMIDSKIMPFFKCMRMCDIAPKDVLRWQNTFIGGHDDEGNEWSQTYLGSINSQLSALFNHAVRFYGLQSNPVKKAKPMGDKKGPEMKFWTKDRMFPRSKG